MHKASLYALQSIFILMIVLFSKTILAYPMYKPQWSVVEKKFLDKNGRREAYPHEYFPVVQVQDQYELGKLTALRFIEWVQNHPNAVVGLTSGNTPEFFIKFLSYYKLNWHLPHVQEELQSYNINLKNFPNTKNLKLVQLEELYPMAPNHTKKVSNYMLRNYVAILGIKPHNILLMDIEQRGILAEKGINVVFMNGVVEMSVLNDANSQVDLWQQKALNELYTFCKDYERKIRNWGGIDFFVGGLTHSGHLAFNEPNGVVDSKTHVVKLNYATSADVAQNVGGMDFARGKLGITVGLSTIGIKPDAVKIIIASGGVKANAVRDAIENQSDPKYPASILQKYRNSRFYITDGAATLLEDRQVENLSKIAVEDWNIDIITNVLTYISKAQQKAILALTEQDLQQYERGKLLMSKVKNDLNSIKRRVHDTLVKRIENGLELSNPAASRNKNVSVLHTAPHHEDIILGYHPFLYSLQKAKNYFAFFTSGFNSVTDKYVLKTLNRASDGWLDKNSEIIFNKNYSSLLLKFNNEFDRGHLEQLETLDTIFVLRNVAAIYKATDMEELKNRIRWLKDDYFPYRQPGDLDTLDVQLLKGSIRESEAERHLSLLKIPLQNITHLRSKFYSGHEFKRTPRYLNDVVPFITLMRSIKPKIITVQDDPQSGPPITNYRVLQIVAQAVYAIDPMSKNNIDIIGYRNTSYGYKVHEANIYMPVEVSVLTDQAIIFDSCFNTQKMSSFPSPFYAGDDAKYALKLQQEQLNELKLLLGETYFTTHRNPRIKNAQGFVYLNKMSIENLLSHATNLQPAIDLDEAFIK